MRHLAAILLLAAMPAIPLRGQRAQLARKGRQPEAGKAVPRVPLRKLPRRGAVIAVPVARPLPERPVQAPPTLSEDRVRSLLRGTITPLPPAEPVAELVRTRPQIPIIPPVPGTVLASVKTEIIPNRWKIFPSPPWRRYDDKHLDAIYASSRYWDPFNRNTIKGDFPIHERKLFFSFTGTSDTTFETRRIPLPSGASAADPGEYDFFGRGEQYIEQQNFRFSLDLFHGAAGFKPVDWEIRVTPEFNINHVHTQENGVINIDVTRGLDRTDSNVGMQELFFEKRLWADKAYFDFASVRAGIQRFTSDFRGLIFSDEQPGARLLGTFHNNILQANLVYFNMLEKDTNSGLNRWRLRQQQVYIANAYWSDFLTKGYTLNFSALYNHDQPSFFIDKNGFLVRPAPVGMPVPHKISAGYVGITGDGHIKRFNVNNSFYQAFGRDTENPIAAAPQHINAQLATFELGYDKDWMEFKTSVFYASGDKNINDGHANGFDAIVPNQQFAGGGFLGNPSLADRGLLNNSFAGGGTNFLNREPLPLSGTGLLLFGPNSLLPNMRPGLFEGQANFVNPGILLFNGAFNAKITPKIRTIVNVNWAKFNRTEVLEAVLFQSNIHHAIGLDTGIGVQYRPLLNDNITVTGGVGTLVPGQGFKDIYGGKTLFSAFVNLRMVF
jgi:hypothetical protein